MLFSLLVHHQWDADINTTVQYLERSAMLVHRRPVSQKCSAISPTKHWPIRVVLRPLTTFSGFICVVQCFVTTSILGIYIACSIFSTKYLFDPSYFPRPISGTIHRALPKPKISVYGARALASGQQSTRSPYILSHIHGRYRAIFSCPTSCEMRMVNNENIEVSELTSPLFTLQGSVSSRIDCAV